MVRLSPFTQNSPNLYYPPPSFVSSGGKLAILDIWKIGDCHGLLFYLINNQLHGPELCQATATEDVLGRKNQMSLGKMGKTPQDGFWQTQEMTQLFICLKNSIIQKGEKIFNINFQVLTSFGVFFGLILKVIWILEQRFHWQTCKHYGKGWMLHQSGLCFTGQAVGC